MARSSDSLFPLSLLRDRTFQAREIRRVMKLAAIYLTATTVLVGVFYHQMLGQMLAGAAPMLFVSEDMSLAADAIPSLGAVLGKWLFAMLALNAVITIALGVYILRKLGAPLLAIKRSLREIGNGNLDVRMRADDDAEFGELVDELARAMASVRHHVQAARAGLDRPDDAQGAITDCRAALDWFKLDGAKAANADESGEADSAGHAGNGGRASDSRAA